MNDRSHPADQLIARALAGDASPAEEESLRAWRLASPENEARALELARLAELAAALPRTVAAGPPPTVADLERRLAAARRTRDPARGRGWRPRLWSLAAAATLVVGVGTGVVFMAARSGAPGGPGAEVGSVTTGPSEPATLTFRDGTVVRLGPDSRLAVHEFGTERRVRLTGRGYFAVATDPAGRPFLVDTPAGEVRVLGTRFEVTARAENLEVVVVDGRVALSNQAGLTEVAGGQIGRVVNGKPLPAVTVEDPYARMGWVGKFLAFHATPLDAAAREIERRYEVRIRITDPALAERTITTWFSGWELDDVMTVFCTIVEAKCSADGDEITVAPMRPNGA